MRSICALLWLALLASCTTTKTNPQAAAPAAETLIDVSAKRDLYEGLLVDAAKPQGGWIGRDCDGLLYSSLFGAALKDKASYAVAKASDVPGHWLRRALDFGSCYPGISDSSIAKDDLLGLVFFAWRAADKDILEALVTYGEQHQWVMGDPASNVGKVIVTPSLAALMYQALYKLGGADNPARLIPDVFPAGLVGFEAHLQVVGILLHGEIDDAPGISDDMLARLREHAAAQPQNPLYAAALALYSGDQTAALALLGDETQWPKTALPGPQEHCSAWLIQRDDGNDYQPCASPDTQTMWGADYVFVADLLTRPRRGS